MTSTAVACCSSTDAAGTAAAAAAAAGRCQTSPRSSRAPHANEMDRLQACRLVECQTLCIVSKCSAVARSSCG